MKVILEILFLWTFMSYVYCDIWSVPPLVHFNRVAMTGPWWSYKWLPPPGFNHDNLRVSNLWNVNYKHLTDTYHMLGRGRCIVRPDVCKITRATACPAGPPGIWAFKDSDGRDLEMKLVKTDYITYKALIGCSPRFQPGCSLEVDVRTRMPFAGKKLRHFLDNMIRNYLCLNPNDFYDVQRLSVPFPGC